MSKKFKSLTKIISLMLSIILIYQVSPVNAVAATVSDLSDIQSDSSLENAYNDNVNIYYGSHSLDAGRAGTLRVNDYTLTASLSIDALSIGGNIYPVSISMKYNSAENRFLDEIAGIDITSYGNGWSTDYNSYIIELAYADKTFVAYTTGDGSVVLFEQTEIADDEAAELPVGTEKWIPLSSYDLYIYKYTDESAESGQSYQYVMFTGNEEYSFDFSGRLVKVRNIKNNTNLNLSYNDGVAFDAIDKITDGVGREFRFAYADDLLTKIKAYDSDGEAIIAGDENFSAPLEISFAYENGNLVQVTFPDGETSSYTYNSSDKIVTAVNIDGYKAQLDYSGGNVCKIAEYALDKNGDYVAGNYINISVDGNTRTFTDSKGDVQIKTFDDNGNIVSIVDGEGNYLYGEPVASEESSDLYEEETTDIFIEETSDIFVDEATSDIYVEEDSSEMYSVSLCPCENCPEWECDCACESEEVCTCIQCKRYYDTFEDDYGNVISEESFDGTKKMTSVNTYTSNGNYLESSVDTAGNTVYYVYGTDGFLDSVTSGDSTVNFAYDSMGNLIGLYQQVGEGYILNYYEYENDRISSIWHNGFYYNFTYDEWGNQIAIGINDVTLVTYEYDSENPENITKISYANGQSETYLYDDNDNIVGISHDGGETNVYEFEYDSDGMLTKASDFRAGYVTTYTDTSTEMRTIEDGTLIYSSVYNADGTQTEKVLDFAITYTYNSEYNKITGVTVSEKSFAVAQTVYNEDTSEFYNYEADVDTSVSTDWFDRTESKEISVDVSVADLSAEETSEYHVSGEYSFIYDDTDTTASTKITAHSSSFESDSASYDRTDYYEYDQSGNITAISRYCDVDGEQILVPYYRYQYDEAGQLVREDILEQDKTIVYLYDFGGNIGLKKEYTYTLDEITDDMTPVATSTYSYSNSDDADYDILTKFVYKKSSSKNPKISSALTYDMMGNVTSFNGYTYTWTAGRQLESSTTEDGDLCKYYYNENGFLSRIDVYYDGDDLPSMFYLYTWDGDRLISRDIVAYDMSEKLTSRMIYDADGEAQGFIFDYYQYGKRVNFAVFLYRKNLQGDVTGVIDPQTGEVLAEFTYDAYGNISIITDGSVGAAIVGAICVAISPILYRGYVYANLGGEMAYYLGSRYYVPQFGRFLNADKHVDTETGVLGTNMYAYCNNNPVMFIDPTGELISLMNTILDVTNAFVSLISSIFNSQKTSWIYAVSVLKLSNKKKYSRTKSVDCEAIGLRYIITIHYTLGTYKNRQYVIMTSFDLDFVNLGSNYYYEIIEYSYGCSSTVANSVGFSQSGAGSTTKKYFSKKTPFNWMAVNIASYEQMKAYIGASVCIVLYEKGTKDYYTFYFTCLTDEYNWNLFRNNNSNSEYFGFGSYDAKWGIYI